jgi:hypothetical protein
VTDGGGLHYVEQDIEAPPAEIHRPVSDVERMAAAARRG